MKLVLLLKRTQNSIQKPCFDWCVYSSAHVPIRNAKAQQKPATPDPIIVATPTIKLKKSEIIKQ